MQIQNRLFRHLGMVALATAASSLASVPPASAHPFRTLYAFCAVNCPYGYAPVGIAMDQAGNTFGSMNGGGVHNSGGVYELKRSPNGKNWHYKTLYDFCNLNNCADGSTPEGALVVDVAGNLYGTTSLGGDNSNGGTVFELSPVPGTSKWTEKVIWSFCSRKNGLCGDGAGPAAGLTYAGAAEGQPYDGVSPLYGTASHGGKHASGTAFMLKPAKGGWQLKTLYAFCSQGGATCSDGTDPQERLLVDNAGNVYGTTAYGGTANYGTAFELTPVAGTNTWSFTQLYSFCSQQNCVDGQYPSSGLTLDTSGNLYGMTWGGGTTFGGTLYKLAAGAESVLYSFCQQPRCEDGDQPFGDLAIDASGDLFGTTYYGGRPTRGNSRGGGTLFEYSNSAVSTLYRFCKKTGCPDGANPSWGVILDGAGNAYGVTTFHTGGTVFKWNAPN